MICQLWCIFVSLHTFQSICLIILKMKLVRWKNFTNLEQITMGQCVVLNYAVGIHNLAKKFHISPFSRRKKNHRDFGGSGGNYENCTSVVHQYGGRKIMLTSGMIWNVLKLCRGWLSVLNKEEFTLALILML